MDSEDGSSRRRKFFILYDTWFGWVVLFTCLYWFSFLPSLTRNKLKKGMRMQVEKSKSREKRPCPLVCTTSCFSPIQNKLKRQSFGSWISIFLAFLDRLLSSIIRKENSISQLARYCHGLASRNTLHTCAHSITSTCWEQLATNTILHEMNVERVGMSVHNRNPVKPSELCNLTSHKIRNSRLVEVWKFNLGAVCLRGRPGQCTGTTRPVRVPGLRYFMPVLGLVSLAKFLTKICDSLFNLPFKMSYLFNRFSSFSVKSPLRFKKLNLRNLP